MKIIKIKSEPYRQFFRYYIDVEVIDGNDKILSGSVPSTSLEYIKKLKVGDRISHLE